MKLSDDALALKRAVRRRRVRRLFHPTTLSNLQGILEKGPKSRGRLDASGGSYAANDNDRFYTPRESIPSTEVLADCQGALSEPVCDYQLKERA
jgi:hypothetical protein